MRSSWTLLMPCCALSLAGCDPGPVGDKAAQQAGIFLTAEDDSAPPVRRRPAPESVAAKEGECHFSAWSQGMDAGGTNIRSGPGRHYAIVGKLPPASVTMAGLNGLDAATFNVVESQGGWFRIENASYQRLGSNDDPVPYPSGWIAGQYLGFSLQSDFAFAQPDPKSPIVASGWNDPEGLKTLRYRNAETCRGEWLKLSVAGHDGIEHPGWVRGICGILETTCEGVTSDNPVSTDDLPRF